MGARALSSSSHLFLEEEVPFYTKVHQRTVVTSAEVITEAPLPAGAYCVWARLTPVFARLSADAAYASYVPFVLGGFTAPPDTTVCPAVYTVPIARWQWEPGTAVAVHVAAASAQPAAVRAAMTSTPRRSGTRTSITAAAATLPEPTTDAELAPLARVRLTGALVGDTLEDDEVEWSPFLVCRWLELRADGPSEGTLVYRPASLPSVEGRPVVEGAAAETYFSLFQGGTKEARGVDEERVYVKWADGSVGLMAELVPYRRVFTPARLERPARVRRFPHRNADVVGVLPFGTRAAAIGRHVDPVTGEAYALLTLPADASVAHLPTLYGLANLGPSQWVWGWSKIVGASGLPLLTDVTASAPVAELAPLGDGTLARRGSGMHSGPLLPHRRPLPTPTFYTPTRANKGVRIRRRPTLRSDPIGEVMPNEVKAAVGVLTVNPTMEHERATVHFVEWAAGGFSLLRNATQEFLHEVKILTGPTTVAGLSQDRSPLLMRARNDA